MSLEKLPSGSYRYRKMINGQLILGTFDHEPTDLEIALLIAEKSQTVVIENKPFEACCVEYIKTKENVLSPTTIKSYRSIVGSLSDGLKRLNVNSISSLTIQKEINDYSKGHSPKSTRNLYGLIFSVLRAFRPELVLSVTLPQKIENKAILPSERDIKKLLSAVKDTEYSIVFQLGVLGLRRSEVCALTPEDLDGNMLTINKAKVKGLNNEWIIRPYTKTEGSSRTLYLPDELVNEINTKGYIYNGSPDTLLDYLHRVQKRNKLPRFKLHSLRHYFASYAHAKGIPDQYVMEMGGWSTDGIMKKVYRDAFEKESQKAQKKIGKMIL